jgi:hypothetical protein
LKRKPPLPIAQITTIFGRKETYRARQNIAIFGEIGENNNFRENGKQLFNFNHSKMLERTRHTCP